MVHTRQKIGFGLKTLVGSKNEHWLCVEECYLKCTWGSREQFQHVHSEAPPYWPQRSIRFSSGCSIPPCLIKVIFGVRMHQYKRLTYICFVTSIKPVAALTAVIAEVRNSDSSSSGGNRNTCFRTDNLKKYLYANVRVAIIICEKKKIKWQFKNNVRHRK